MEPSKAAIEAALKAGVHLSNPTQKMGCKLKAAYAIDFAALQQEYEDLLVDRNKLLGKFPALQQENARLKEENERLRSEEVRDKQIYALIARCSDWLES